MEFSGQAFLLDIEGTTSSVSFVYDVMFPRVRSELGRFLATQWEDVDVQLACDQIAQDAGHPSLETWAGPQGTAQRSHIEAEVIRLMDADVKATGLKQLQGLVWRAGFQSGEMQAHLYPDVAPCLEQWRQAGKDVRIYSSGSVQAQHLFFGHTELGNLLPLFSGHYDTNIGGKKEAASYERIASDWQRPAASVLFLSDVVAELDAARTAGYQTALCVRPGNAEVASDHGHESITSFEQIELA